MTDIELDEVNKLLDTLGFIAQMACFRMVLGEPNQNADDCKCYACRSERAVAQFTLNAPLDLIKSLEARKSKTRRDELGVLQF